MEAGPDLTRYFAIRRRNLWEDWQEGFDEIQKADCLEKGWVRKQRGGERRDECLQPLMVEERNRVGCTNFVRSRYIRVKSPNADVADPINSPRGGTGHVHPRTGQSGSRSVGPNNSKSILSP